MEVEMKTLRQESRQLFDLARDAHGPPVGAKERTRKRLNAKLTATAIAGVGMAAPKISMAAFVASLGKVPAITLLLVGTGTVSYGAARVIVQSLDARSAAHSPESQRLTPSQAAKIASAAATVAPTGTIVPDVVVNPAPSSAKTRRSPTVASDMVPVQDNAPTAGIQVPAAPSNLAQETLLIRQAHQNIVNGNPARALAILAQHVEQFPNGALVEERVATQIMAYCKLGRLDEARRALNQFASSWPESPHWARIRTACPWQSTP
jgi:hypothetical protein